MAEPINNIADVPGETHAEKEFEAVAQRVAQQLEGMRPKEEPTTATAVAAPGVQAATAPPAPALSTPAVPAHLLERAREHGLSDAEAADWGDSLERHLNAVDRQLAREYRQGSNRQQQPAPVQMEPPPEDDNPLKGEWWKDGEEEVHPTVRKAVEGVHQHYDKKLKGLEQTVAQLNAHIQQQAVSRDEQIIHDACDAMHAEGFKELGSGRVRPGTQAYEERRRFATVLAGQINALQQAGVQVSQKDMDRLSKNAARLLYGDVQPATSPAAPAQPPPAQPARGNGNSVTLPGETRPRDQRGRFVDMTPTTPPTQRGKPSEPQNTGIEAAIEAVGKLYGNGHELDDIHGS